MRGLLCVNTRGVAGPGSFTPTPPPPPPSLEIGTEVPDHQRQRRPKANPLEERLLDQAQARASYTPFFGVIRVAYPKA